MKKNLKTLLFAVGIFAALGGVACFNSADNNKFIDSSTEPIDSLVYSNLKFGSSLDDVKKTFPNGVDTIGGVEYEVFSVLAPKDSVAGLLFYGQNTSASEIETKIQNDIEALKDAYAAKYGPPNIDNGRVSILKTSNAKDYIQYRWQKPNKTTEIGISSTPKSGFRAYMKIYNDNLLNKAMAALAEKKDSIAQKDSKKF